MHGGVQVRKPIRGSRALLALLAVTAAALASVPPGTRGGTSGPPPAIVGSVTPNHGPVEGGTPVTVLGSYFRPRSIVRFGGVEATQSVVVAQDRVTAVTPPHKAGWVAVTVGGGVRGRTFRYEETRGR